jgi:hypothetical protein
MRITFKRTNGEYTVTVNKSSYTFDSSRDAWEFIFGLKQTA